MFPIGGTTHLASRSYSSRSQLHYAQKLHTTLSDALIGLGFARKVINKLDITGWTAKLNVTCKSYGVQLSKISHRGLTTGKYAVVARLIEMRGSIGGQYCAP